GCVKVFGKNVKEYPLDLLHKNVSIAMQKPYIFKGTLKENIIQGKPDADAACIQKACAIAQADEFMRSLPAGIDTPTEEEGANFSGGQRQRIALARAVIADAPILILDDSSSALDYATDLKFRKALATEYNGSLVVISQRISSMKECSKILVLDDGEAVGFDTHDNLLNHCAIYRDIYASQTQREVSESV
ncbi:MAG: ABC transporter ATP-binding protein, partial [Clostridia bacterium]|nr:ABC transporter ATP-binding protein [Clostridia bacterium]